MELKDIASVAGKPGLFSILKPARNGVIVESIDDLKKKMLVHSSQRISVLKEISIYVSGREDDAVPLEEVMYNIRQQESGTIAVDENDTQALADFLAKALPDYDRDRVRASDIKKLVRWYNLLQERHPEVLDSLKITEAVESESSPQPDTKGDAKTDTDGDKA